MNQSNYELVALKSGQRSVRSRVHGETMHVGTGPRTEAMELHVRQQRLVERAQAGGGRPFIIWDVGLGPGGNALIAMEALRTVAVPVEIHSFDLSTEVLRFALRHASELDYLSGWEATVAALLEEGVSVPSPKIHWRLHRGDFRECLHAAPLPSAIFHDPYSPARNPEMWNMETFSAMSARLQEPDAPPCLLTNYTRSTAVRVTMALAGWFVGTGVAIGEKDQTTVAANRLDLLESPLGCDWLSRVRASANAAPLRGGVYARGPIPAADYAALETLEQFRHCPKHTKF